MTRRFFRHLDGSIVEINPEVTMWQQIKAAWISLITHPSRAALWYAFRALAPIHYWHDNVAAHPPAGTLMWHLHHEILSEQLIAHWSINIGPLEDRLTYIRQGKPSEGEQPWQIHRRLRLIDIVRTVPDEYNKLNDEYLAARARYLAFKEPGQPDKYWETPEYVALNTADAEARRALQTYDFSDVHKREHPDCPWNGYSIFPEIESYAQRVKRIIS